MYMYVLRQGGLTLTTVKEEETSSQSNVATLIVELEK